MECRTVYAWLLSARNAESLPDELRSHLRSCASCRQRQHQLLQLDEEIKRLPEPPLNPQRRLRLMQRLDGTPQQQPANSMSARRGGWRNPAVAAAAALLIGIALGWMMHRQPAPTAKTGDVADNDSKSLVKPGEGIIALAVQHDLKLA